MVSVVRKLSCITLNVWIYKCKKIDINLFICKYYKMRARVSLLLIALYSTKIIGSLVYNPIVDKKPSNSTPNHKLKNIFFNKKIIYSMPVEQIEINKCKIELYTITDFVFALLFM